jgi:hypothetical protein
VIYGIGTVTRLAQVSVRTLRYDDELGLLKPAHVDPLTGYLHHAPDQVPRLRRPLALTTALPVPGGVNIEGDGPTELQAILEPDHRPANASPPSAG